MNSQLKPYSRASLCMRAAIDTLPLAIAVLPWGMLTGALALHIGLSPLQAQFMSLLVFAGAAQLSAMTLMVSGASIASIFSSTFVISARHLLYSITLREHLQQMPAVWRVSIAMVLTDEMFAVSQAHTLKAGAFSPVYALASGVTFYIVWNIATFVGIVIGDQVQDLDALGLDFAIVATFIAMTFANLKTRPILVAVLVSGVLAVVIKPIFSDSHIILAALAGMCAAYFTDTRKDIANNDGVES